MHFVRCRIAMNLLFMYFRQNSHIHSRPSGTTLYSCGNGARNHVSISYAPKRIIDTGKALPLHAALASVIVAPEVVSKFRIENAPDCGLFVPNSC